MGDSLKLSQLRYVGINAYAEHVQLPRCSYVIVTGFPLIAMKRIVKWCTRVRTCVSHVSKGRFASASERESSTSSPGSGTRQGRTAQYLAEPLAKPTSETRADKLCTVNMDPQGPQAPRASRIDTA